MNFGRKSRKALYLSTTILRGRRLKDDNESGGAVDTTEVGPGFAAAAEKLSGDDNRTPEQKAGATQEIEGETNDDGNAEAPADGEGDGEGDGETEAKEKPAPKKKDRDTAQYIRDLKREAREEKAARAQLEQRLAVLEKGGLPKPETEGNSGDTSEKPNPADYTLGVLDDGYTADLIEWTATQKVAKALGKIQQDQETANAERAEQLQQAALRAKMDELTAKGAELFADFEEEVVESGLRGDWKLTQATFEAAAKVTHGAEILHFLATNPDEALRVSKLDAIDQAFFVKDKNAEIGGKKLKPRTKPKAEDLPSDTPRGRNSSAPIRADTDNLDDFRKLLYQK
jgi:hypothetical protein